MQKDINVYLNDILFSIELIEKYIVGLSYNKFEASYDAQDKVLRRLEIIAEKYYWFEKYYCPYL